MSISQKNCPLCQMPSAKHSVPEKSFDFVLYDCPSCGRFAIDTSFFAGQSQNFCVDENKRIKLAILAAERSLHKKGSFFLQKSDKAESVNGYEQYIPVTLDDFLREYPSNGIEVFDRILLNLSVLLPRIDSLIDLKSVDGRERNKWYLYCSNQIDVEQVRGQLETLGYLSEGRDYYYCIGTKGWERLKELQKSNLSGTAFLAMWFDTETEPLRSAVREAVRQAGYSPEDLTVDESHHNDFIMDKVVNMIDDARFVIADFTCVPEDNASKGVRGGVYFEAGFARGRGKQVMHTCRDDDEAKRRLHFDVGQINTIFWKDDDGALRTGENDFVVVLRERIIATVGKGPYFKNNS